MRLSIRSKLISTSTLLVAFVVVVFAAVTQQMVKGDLHSEQNRVIERRLQAMRETGVLLTQMVTQGALPLLADYQIPNLNRLMARLVGRSETSGVEVLRAAILTRSGDPVAWAPVDPPLRFTPADLGVASFDAIQEAHIHAIAGEDTHHPGNFRVVAPIESPEVRLGYAVLEFGTGPLLAELQEITDYTAQRAATIQRNTTILGGLAIVLGILIAILQSLRITNPILRLAASAEKIAAGDLETRARVSSRDEIGKLGHSFNNMAERVQELLHETREKATMQKELEVARIIQETLLPPSGVIERDNLRIFGYFRSASVCGGDFWNVTDLEDGRSLIVIGDVTGHGVPSAMLTASAKSSMDTVRNIRGKGLSLTYLLEEMNRTIFASAKRKFVMTFFAMAVDLSRTELTFCNAGHNFPFLVRKEDGKVGVRGLVARGNRLGDVEDSRYMEQKISLQSGDLIALFTDGLTEYRNNNGDEYSERRLRRILEQCHTLDAEEVGRTILRDLSQFAAQAPQEDDVTVVVVKVGNLHAAASAVRRESLPAPPSIS
jgi:serine phosphatase RsbU (regulator of sigma subunit)